MTAPLVCPECHVPLDVRPDSLGCRQCAAIYPVQDGIADFSGGRYYDNFVPGQSLSEEERRGLEIETPGAVARMEDFYRPLLERLRSARGGGPLRVLDCGCGNGSSVDLLAGAGFEAWGNDLSALRKWQWRERLRRDRLVVADSSRLPFASGYFEAVLCSGVLEHVGVAEERGDAYRVRPLAEKEEARRQLLAELLRVLSPDGGRLWLDFPNGSFPIDFWHGTTPGAARLHSRHEGFLPTVDEVRGYLASVDPNAKLLVSGPSGRLRFQQVSRHWYGRLLARPADIYLRALSLPGLRRLRESAANPFLILEVSRAASGPATAIGGRLPASGRSAGSERMTER